MAETGLSTRAKGYLDKLSPKARSVIEGGMKRANRKAMVAAAEAAKAPVMGLTGAALAGAIDAAVDWEMDVGPVKLTAGKAASIAALVVGVVEGNQTLSAMGMGGACVVAYELSNKVTENLLEEYMAA